MTLADLEVALRARRISHASAMLHEGQVGVAAFIPGEVPGVHGCTLTAYAPTLAEAVSELLAKVPVR